MAKGRFSVTVSIAASAFGFGVGAMANATRADKSANGVNKVRGWKSGLGASAGVADLFFVSAHTAPYKIKPCRGATCPTAAAQPLVCFLKCVL